MFQKSPGFRWCIEIINEKIDNLCQELRNCETWHTNLFMCDLWEDNNYMLICSYFSGKR